MSKMSRTTTGTCTSKIFVVFLYPFWRKKSRNQITDHELVSKFSINVVKLGKKIPRKCWKRRMILFYKISAFVKQARDVDGAKDSINFLKNLREKVLWKFLAKVYVCFRFVSQTENSLWWSKILVSRNSYLPGQDRSSYGYIRVSRSAIDRKQN